MDDVAPPTETRRRRAAAPTGARLAAIAVHYPAAILDNRAIAARHARFQPEKVSAKTGIERRYLAAPQETASDLACQAAERLFAENPGMRSSVDYLIFCTQAPDHFLPSSSCILHHRLDLPSDAGAVDINLGCSGFVYGLGQAVGLIASGQAERVLLLTSDTYSKFISEDDIGTLTIFGDGAAAVLIEADLSGAMGPFVYGTDGTGAGRLIVETGGLRRPAATGETYIDMAGTERNGIALAMDGPAVFNFTIAAVPSLVEKLLAKSGLGIGDIDLFVFHQANATMLEALRRRIGLPRDRFWVDLADGGNTVSSTIPMALARADAAGRLSAGMRVMLVGFGVGYSWAATLVRWG